MTSLPLYPGVRRRQGLGTYLLKEAEAFANENGVPVILTSAGDWNVDFFKRTAICSEASSKTFLKDTTATSFTKRFEHLFGICRIGKCP